jgi:hypothetical protein
MSYRLGIKSKSSFFPLSSILPSVDDKNILYIYNVKTNINYGYLYNTTNKEIIKESYFIAHRLLYIENNYTFINELKNKLKKD